MTERALFAIQALRRKGVAVAGSVGDAIYKNSHNTIPAQTEVLSSIYWPLICTTNYDDIYFRAILNKRFLPRILGRSETDCRQMLRHLIFPAGEVVWALQGFLRPRCPKVAEAIGPSVDPKQLEDELVVGHAEYRKAAHRAPHFRRCFAELFRTKSLFFLGSGLAEPYFLALFDEIIELTGPPNRPHFAIIQDGEVDPQFLRQQYHIICNTYPKEQHGHVTDLLQGFCKLLAEERVRPSAWGFRISSPRLVNRSHAIDHFKVVRAGLPKPETLSSDEVVAISCGREESWQGSPEGRPRASDDGARMIRLVDRATYSWLGNWLVKWSAPAQSYGIVAREKIDTTSDTADSSRDRRSPDAIRIAFLHFLNQMESQKVRAAHVQLLAAGKGRVFQPWVSLVQMARAYGEWFRGRHTADPAECLQVNLYVVDPSVIAMIQGGYVDLVEQLEDTPIRLGVEIIDRFGQTDRYHEIIRPDSKLSDITPPPMSEMQPVIYAHPIPTLNFKPKPLMAELDRSIREFGLVSGSTLYIDYRARMIAV